MSRNRLGVGSYLGLAVVVAINLALLRGVTELLTIPSDATFLVLLDLALARLLILRRPLSSFDIGFIVAGLGTALLTFSYNFDPYILRFMLDRYREVTGQPKIFRYTHIPSIVYFERMILGVLILLSAVAGGALAEWERCRTSRRAKATDQVETIEF